MRRKPTLIDAVASVAVLSTFIAILLGMYCLRLRDELRSHDRAFNKSFDDPHLVELTKARAEVIADAIEAYRSEHGNCPRSLNALEPKFLQEVPLPIAGEPSWQYRAGADAFSLTFGVQFYGPGDYYPCYSYNSKTLDWYADF